MQSDAHLIFSYGSNSTAQLRARVHNPHLRTHRALVRGYVRVFAGYASAWRGSTATLARLAGGVVRGAVAELTDAEKALLDEYERSYDLVPMAATVYLPDGAAVERTAHAYIRAADAPMQPSGTAVPFPSEQYLCAVSGMLAEHWPPATAHAIQIRAVHDGEVVVRGEWTHPNAHAHPVCSLEAAAVEINLRKEQPWKMPRGANAFGRRAVAVGIKTAAQIWDACIDDAPQMVVRRVFGEGEEDFEIDEGDVGQAIVKVLADSGIKHIGKD